MPGRCRRPSCCAAPPLSAAAGRGKRQRRRTLWPRSGPSPALQWHWGGQWGRGGGHGGGAPGVGGHHHEVRGTHLTARRRGGITSATPLLALDRPDWQSQVFLFRHVPPSGSVWPYAARGFQKPPSATPTCRHTVTPMPPRASPPTHVDGLDPDLHSVGSPRAGARLVVVVHRRDGEVEVVGGAVELEGGGVGLSGIGAREVVGVVGGQGGGAAGCLR